MALYRELGRMTAEQGLQALQTTLAGIAPTQTKAGRKIYEDAVVTLREEIDRE